MIKLNMKTLATSRDGFTKAGVKVPSFDVDEARRKTIAAPAWVHFSAGNLFRAFHASLAQRLLEKGAAETGVIVAEPFDYELIDAVYTPHDNLALKVVMKPDGSHNIELIAAIAESIKADCPPAGSPQGGESSQGWERVKALFRSPSLQMITLSITEKGYNLREPIEAPSAPVFAVPKLAALMLERYKAGKLPLALVSTDNFSRNGDRLKEAMNKVAQAWLAQGFVDKGFADYIADNQGAQSPVSYPLSMIDKITPYPSETVKAQLEKAGIEGMHIIKTAKNSVSAPFVNTEEAEYLVIEDRFPNGRPALEQAGVYFVDRDTVDKADRMKVCTCLNPLHTSLAVFGCLLGYDSIAAEMRDDDLVKLVQGIGYHESLPVVADPGVIKPKAFIDEVLQKRFPNPANPDTPQRIATDTSQKLGIRFGETIRLYRETPGLEPSSLRLIPLVIAAWCRYLLATDDEGKAFSPSPDPLLSELQPVVASATNAQAHNLKPILSNEKLFGCNLYDVGLGEKIEGYFAEMLAGNGAVRKTLHTYVG